MTSERASKKGKCREKAKIIPLDAANSMSLDEYKNKVETGAYREEAVNVHFLNESFVFDENLTVKENKEKILEHNRLERIRYTEALKGRNKTADAHKLDLSKLVTSYVYKNSGIMLNRDATDTAVYYIYARLFKNVEEVKFYIIQVQDFLDTLVAIVSSMNE